MQGIIEWFLQNLTATGLSFTAILEILLRRFPSQKPLSLLRLEARILDFIIKDRVKK